MSKRRIADELKPIKVSETCWLYAERRGLVVVQEKRRIDGSLVATADSTIPWQTVRDALAKIDGNK